MKNALLIQVLFENILNAIIAENIFPEYLFVQVRVIMPMTLGLQLLLYSAYRASFFQADQPEVNSAWMRIRICMYICMRP